MLVTDIKTAAAMPQLQTGKTYFSNSLIISSTDKPSASALLLCSAAAAIQLQIQLIPRKLCRPQASKPMLKRKMKRLE